MSRQREGQRLGPGVSVQITQSTAYMPIVVGALVFAGSSFFFCIRPTFFSLLKSDGEG